VRSDNYAYLLIDETTKEAAAVHPYDMQKVQAAADQQGVKIIANLTTHHHNDHSGGNNDFHSKYPDAPIIGGSKQGEAVDKIVKDKDEFTISEQLKVKCYATPCHTQDSICYYVTDKFNTSQPGVVFTGDTLFQGGCGRFFEGNASEMHAALSYLGTLDSSTVVYNGHEYTKSSLAFGKSVEPSSTGMKRLEDLVQNNSVTTGKSTIGDEKEWNVFMRLDKEDVLKAVGGSQSSPVDVMKKLREMKNSFRN